MTPNHEKPDEPGDVVPFRPRATRAPPSAPGRPSVIEPVDKYARDPDHTDDYRHRMTMNIAAFAVCAVLVVLGVWMVNVIADMRKTQDCVLSGRRNCAALEIPAGDRY